MLPLPCPPFLLPAPISALTQRPVAARAQGLVESYNLANYLGLQPVRALHMPVPLHMIFIGFEGWPSLAPLF